jgi:uncharacterized integral membrane protein
MTIVIIIAATVGGIIFATIISCLVYRKMRKNSGKEYIEE